MIVVTGAKGFIGSNLIAMLEAEDSQLSVIAVDWISPLTPELNLKNRKNIGKMVQPERLNQFLSDNRRSIEAVVHLGAISSTVQNDEALYRCWNSDYGIDLFRHCADLEIPMIYASSASIYGNGNGPLSLYAESKKAIDDYATHITYAPPRWAGLRFFNVYGPNEWHKGRQASMVTQLYGKEEAYLYEGRPTRDFIHVRDCCEVMMDFLAGDEVVSGILDVGTGTSRPFEDIAIAFGIPVNYVPMPDELAKQYQIKTCAKMNWAGENFRPMTLEEGISDYVSNHLSRDDPYL